MVVNLSAWSFCNDVFGRTVCLEKQILVPFLLFSCVEKHVFLLWIFCMNVFGNRTACGVCISLVFTLYTWQCCSLVYLYSFAKKTLTNSLEFAVRFENPDLSSNSFIMLKICIRYIPAVMLCIDCEMAQIFLSPGIFQHLVWEISTGHSLGTHQARQQLLSSIPTHHCVDKPMSALKQFRDACCQSLVPFRLLFTCDGAVPRIFVYKIFTIKSVSEMLWRRDIFVFNTSLLLGILKTDCGGWWCEECSVNNCLALGLNAASCRVEIQPMLDCEIGIAWHQNNNNNNEIYWKFRDFRTSEHPCLPFTVPAGRATSLFIIVKFSRLVK